MNHQPNTRIEQYKIQSSLGMDEVLKAADLNLARAVALKVMHPQVGSEPEFDTRVLQKARSATNLGHPSIVTVHHFGSSQGLLDMVMSYVEGGSLN